MRVTNPEQIPVKSYYDRAFFVLKRRAIDLKPCRVQLWNGCAFVNFNESALHLIEQIGF